MGAIYGEAYYRQNLVYTCAKHIVFQQDNPLRVQKTNYLINKTFRAQQSSKEFDVDSHLGPKKVIYICQYICIYQYIYIHICYCYFIVISPSDKGGDVVIMDSMVYNQKLMDLLDDNNTCEQISLQTITNYISNFNKSYKKLISNEDQSWSSLINYHPIIPKIYGLPKTHKPDIPLRPIISGIGSAPHNIAKLLAKLLTPLLGTISNAHLKNSGSLLNKTN